MTLTLAWVRSHGTWDELIVASDSRLTGGHEWDTAPKIIPLPRGDAVVAFAGDTRVAYPMMIQAVNVVASWDKAANRGLTLEQLRKHLVRVFNLMLSEMHDQTRLEKELGPQALFLLAGFSWKSRRYMIWTVHFDHSIGRFTFRAAANWRGNHDRRMLALVGDCEDEAKTRLIHLLRQRKRLSKGEFNYEPLEILAEMIADPSFRSVGGYPQMVQVQRSLKAVPAIVPWVVGGGPGLTFMGRPLLPHEKLDRVPEFSWSRCLKYP